MHKFEEICNFKIIRLLGCQYCEKQDTLDFLMIQEKFSNIINIFNDFNSEIWNHYYCRNKEYFATHQTHFLLKGILTYKNQFLQLHVYNYMYVITCM